MTGYQWCSSGESEGRSMSEWIFQTDAYRREFEAAVIAVAGNAIALDRTAFYPGGGGQPADRGWLQVRNQRYQVVNVRKEGEEIWHELDREPPSMGTALSGLVDWDRRYALMRTHTALHILCGVIWRDYGAHVTGGNMEPLRGRMDFEFEHMRKEFVQEIEEKVNVEVAAARPVQIRILPREEAFTIPDLIRTKINLLPEGITQVRVVDIVGLDLQADGGTHVASTSEVGRLHIVDYKSKGRMNKRLEIVLE
jgi:misacylated tRNA(Ala) deacylase